VAYTLPAEAEITALQGHRFPEGSYTVEHWESFLLSDCTGASSLPDQQVHPIALFHIPFLAGGTSIAQLFALGQAESDLSIMIESYDWEFFSPLRESTLYTIRGEILSAQRLRNPRGQISDRIQFCFDLSDKEVPVARSTITWHFTRNTL